jgi:hypothetical protein
MSKISVELEISDELARAVAIRNTGSGMARSYEVQQWAKETLEAAADNLIEQMRTQQEENA